MLLYSIADRLYGYFSCFRGIFQYFQDLTNNLTFKLSMVRNKKLFKRLALRIGAFQKVQLEMIHFPYIVKKWKDAVNCPKIVAYTVKIFGLYNFWTPVENNISDVWNWNCWTLFGLVIEVGVHGLHAFP